MSKSEKLLYDMSITLPPPSFRKFCITLQFNTHVTEQEVNELNLRLSQQSDLFIQKGNESRQQANAENALSIQMKTLERIALLTEKISPLIPYEKEIVERYIQLHIDMGRIRQIHARIQEQIPPVEKRINDIRPSFAQIKKQYNDMMSNAAYGHEEGNTKILSTRIPIEVMQEFNSQLDHNYKETKAVYKQYLEWYNLGKEMEKETKRVNNERNYFHSFITEFYDEQEKYTLHCNSFNKDYLKFIKESDKEVKGWNPGINAANKLSKHYEDFINEYNSMHEYIKNWDPTATWRTKFN